MTFRSFALASVFATLASNVMADVPDTVSPSGAFLASRTASHLMDLGATIDYTSAALAKDPSNGVLTERLLQAEVMKGDIAKAEELAPQVLKSNSQERTARMVLGLKEFRARRFPEARAQFEEAAYTPFGILTSTLLTAWAYVGENQLNGALRELEKLNGQDAFANYKAFHAALMIDQSGSTMRADVAYKKAYELAPTSLRVVQAYGNFLERQGRKDEASKVYRSYLNADPTNMFITKSMEDVAGAEKPAAFVGTPLAGAGEVLFSVASALSVDQSGDAALIYSQLALANSTDKAFVLTTLAGVQSGLKDFSSSNASFEQIPKDSMLRNYADTEIAVNLQRMDQSPDALARLKDVVARDPKDTDALVTIAGVYRSTDKNDDAVDAYTKALALLKDDNGNTWRVYYDRGIAFDHLKQYDKSEGDFRKALALSKDDPQVLNYLGYSMIDRNVNLDEAIGMVKKAVSLKPNDGYITDSLGWAYYTLRDYAQAATYCERAVDLIPSDATIAEHLGDVYWRQGRKLEASFQWQHALDNHPDEADVPRIKAELKDGLPDLVDAKPAENTAAPAPAADAPKPSNG